MIYLRHGGHGASSGVRSSLDEFVSLSSKISCQPTFHDVRTDERTTRTDGQPGFGGTYVCDGLKLKLKLKLNLELKAVVLYFRGTA